LTEVVPPRIVRARREGDVYGSDLERGCRGFDRGPAVKQFFYCLGTLCILAGTSLALPRFTFAGTICHFQ